LGEPSGLPLLVTAMIYDFPVTVLTTNTEDDPAIEDAKLTHGVVHRIEVEFPAGQIGLIHVVINHMGHQVWPSNPAGSFASDDHVVAFDDYYPLLFAPYRFKIIAWTDGTNYDHTVKVRFGLLPESIAKKRFGTISAADQARITTDLLAGLTSEGEG
jgi:hypothetical protein